MWRYGVACATFVRIILPFTRQINTDTSAGTQQTPIHTHFQMKAERRLSPDYNRYEKALQCTTKTHRCLHAAHAYTGIPCAAYSEYIYFCLFFFLYSIHILLSRAFPLFIDFNLFRAIWFFFA